MTTAPKGHPIKAHTGWQSCAWCISMTGSAEADTAALGLAPVQTAPAAADENNGIETMAPCADCGTVVEQRLLSGLGTCSACVGKRVHNYRALHDGRMKTRH